MATDPLPAQWYISSTSPENSASDALVMPRSLTRLRPIPASCDRDIGWRRMPATS